MKQKTGRKLLSFLLTLAMVVGMFPGMSLTAYAANDISCTSGDIGKVLCTDGSIYASVSAATSAGKTAAAMIAYLDMENRNGLALALSDDYNKQKWTDITSHSPAVTGGTWVLASETQWTQMITAMGSDGLRDGFSSIGGTNLQNDYYWSSTTTSSGHRRYDFKLKEWSKGGSYLTGYGRACLTFNFTPIVPTTYEVTYKVVNGTWSDDSTTDKTETVQSGSKPSSVPTGMKAASGYTGGAWDTDPTGTTINGATTFTYTFTALPTYQVTYRVVNGTWSDDTTADKTETVQSGSTPASVPTGMKAASGYTGGAWDTNPAEATITGATTFTYTFTALPTYQVTYRVVNGTWSDDTTADKTETVQSGSKPASVPTGMKAASGYTGGAWDTDPTDATITGATTFTYTFTALPTYTVTYKVVNGTWSDYTTTDKTETVQSGSKPSSVPTGMKAASGYTGGAWDTDPTDATITGATTFTYTFTALPSYEVTYKVVNGTWSNDSTADKTENVQSGSKPSSVPTGMKAASGYTGGAWDTDPTDATITGAKTFTYTFTAIPTYTVTYKVVNGTWSDDSTTDKTETVQSDSKPASVPTGMKAASGYTGGAWDTNPAEATITGATTFTYTFTALPTYQVTYKVVNGTWSDGTTTDMTETVQSGSKPASVPTGMKAASGYTGGAWDTNPAEATITGATTFTYTFTALPTYQVTYRVVNGTWSDDTTADKTETVQSGSKPASVPTGMKASQGFTGGAWDENPADATITGAKTFTYTFTAIPTYTVTYKVVNGTWSDDTTTDKTETVQSGSKPASVPTGMKAASGYTGGAWDTDPAGATITEATTFTYTFTAIPIYTVTVTNDGHGTGSAAPVSGAEGTEVTLNATPAEGYAFKEWQVVSGSVTVKDNKFTIGTANVEIKAVFEQAGDMEDEVIVEPGAPAVSGTNIDEVAAGVVTADEVAAGVKVWVDISPLAEAAVPAGNKALANQAMQGFGGTAGAWIDMSMFKQVTGQNKTAVHQTATAFRFSMKVPDSLKKAGRTFWLLRLHNDKADILATTTGDTLSGETNLFSTYLIAYKDAETPTPTPKPVPKTGDQDYPGLWIILMLIGIAGLTVIGTLKVSRKRK